MKSMKSMKGMKGVRACMQGMKSKPLKPKLPKVKWQTTSHTTHVGKHYVWEVASAIFTPSSVDITWRGEKKGRQKSACMKKKSKAKN